MRKFIAIAAVLLFCAPALATTYYHIHHPWQTTSGEAITGAVYHIYTPNTTDTVAVYSDRAGTRSYQGTDNLTTDAGGMVDIYVESGCYDIALTRAAWSLAQTWEDYCYGVANSDSINITGTVEAYAFDADEWIDAGGNISGATLETSGATALGGGVTTGGAVDIGGALYVRDRTSLGYDEVGNDYSLTITPNWIIVRPLLEVHDDLYVYGDVRVFGKDATSGRLVAQIVESDTLKPRTGAVVEGRTAAGKDALEFHTQFICLTPVDISVSLPDTTNYDVGTLMYCSDDSFRYLAGAGIAKEWRTLAYAGYVAGEDNPELYLPTTTLNYAYADSHVQKFGVGNSGDGILSWESSFLSDWIADAANDTGTVGVGYDSVTVQLMWAQIDSGASLHDTVAVVTDYGNGQVVINADGKPLVGGDYRVEPNHPRLFFNEDELAALRTKCKSAESARYDAFIDRVDNYMLGDSYPFTYLYDQADQLEHLAFAFITSQDTIYLAEAVECAESMFSDWPTDWWDEDDVVKGLSVFYDWCYNDMGSTRRDLFGDSLAVMCDRYTTDTNFMTNAPHTQNTVVPELVYAGLALDGDGYDDTAASAALDTAFAHMFGDYHIIACFDSIGRDGGGYESEYSEGLVTAMTEALWLWTHGSDVDAFAQSSCITGWGNFMLYDTYARTEVVDHHPTDPARDYQLYAFGQEKRSDDNMYAGTRAEKMLLTNRLATAYQDSTLIWLSDQFDDHTSAGVSSPADWWRHIIAQDTLMTAAAPTTARGYTTAKQFDLGVVFMREDWNVSPDSTDVWGTYRHEQFPYGHAAADAGHFSVGRGHDLLLIDSGEYIGCSGSHASNYYRQTVAHNAITIKDFSESFGGYANSGGQQLLGLDECGLLPATLGGYTDSLTTIYGNRGSIDTYEHRPDTLTYIKSDLTLAYSSAKVDTVRREFVWMEPDGVFLVFDYAAVDSTGYLQKSLFHFINNPTDNGDATWTVVHGTSEATLRFLGNASVAEVGGSGAEFMAAGTNYPIPANQHTHSDNGAYRLEAVMSRYVDQRWLLTIIETSVVGGADYGTVSFVADIDDYVGAVVNGDTVLFHRYGGAYEYREQ